MNPNKLIERLADKTLSFGCRVNCGGFTDWIMINDKEGIKQNIVGEGHYIGQPLSGKYKVIGHPILIGDVLDKMMSTDSAPSTDGELIELWRDCGFTRSLQEIFEDVDEECNKHITVQEEPCSEECPYALKPKAQNLFTFLEKIL